MAINIITPDHGSLTVTEVEGVANITAVPDTGYSLTSVQAICNDTLLDIVDMSFIIPEDGDVDVSAVFEADVAPVVDEKQHFIDAQYSNGEVRFEINGVTGVAAYAGDVVDIIASPFVGYELSSITGADIQDMQFTMPDSNVNLVISFVQTDFTITCAEFVQADAETGHAGDIITAIPTGLDDGEVFLGFIVECTELGICAWALDVVIEFEMPPYNVTVRQMTEEEAAEYAKITDDGETGDGDVQPMDNSDVDGDSEVDPEDIDVVIPDPPSVTPEPPQDVENPPDGEVPTDPGQDGENPYSPPATIIVTRYTDEIISDFSQESLDFYENSGAIAIAVYDDDTEVEVPWSSVTDPSLPTINLVNEALVVAEATNQHFWNRVTDPEGDTAGTGAFVTDEAQDDFLAAIAAGTEPTTARPLHNLLMNAEGILLRAAKRIRAAFTPSGVAFYDGEGNEESNIVARFEKTLARIGKVAGKHVDVTSSGIDVADGSTSLASFGSTVRVGEEIGTYLTITGQSVNLVNGVEQGGAILANPLLKMGDINGLGSIGLEFEETLATITSNISDYAAGTPIRQTTYIGMANNELDSSVSIDLVKSSTNSRLEISTDGGLTILVPKGSGQSFLTFNEGSLAVDGIGFLPLSGGTLTGQLNGTTADFATRVSSGGEVVIGSGVAGNQYYLSGKTPGRTGRVLFIGGGKKADGDSAGTVVGLGAGGLTIVGGGEYATNRYNVADLNDTAEQLYLGSDNNVFIETGGNTIANRKTFTFTPAGHFIMPAEGNFEAAKRIDLGDRAVSGIDYHARLETSSTGTLHLIASSGGFSSSNTARGDFAFMSDGRLGVRKHNGTDWVSGWTYFNFSSAATLRDSIGAEEAGTCLPLSGGIMTGSIELASGKVLFAKNTTHDVAASSLSAQTDQNVAVCLDKNSNATVGVLSRQLTTGEMRGIFQARHNNASGTAVWNALQLGVKPDGTRTVVLSDKNPWLDALGLGSTTTATSGVVTAASGWTVVLQSLASWGRMRILHLRVKNASATSGTRKVATLAEAHKPKGPDAAIATMYSPTTGSGYITTSGDIYIGGSLAADTEWNGMFIWLV